MSLHVAMAVTAPLSLIQDLPAQAISKESATGAKAADGQFAEQLTDCEASDTDTDEDSKPSSDRGNSRPSEARLLLEGPILAGTPAFTGPTAVSPNASLPLANAASDPSLKSDTIGKVAQPVDPAKTKGDLAFALRVTEKNPASAANQAPTSPSTEGGAKDFRQSLGAAQVEKATMPSPAKGQERESSTEKEKLKAATSAAEAHTATELPPGVAAEAPKLHEPIRALPRSLPLNETNPVPDAPVADPVKVAAPRQLAFRVDAADGTNNASRSVDLVVEQRGAALHFAVKSSDPHLTAELRDSLPELITRLDAQGMRADVQRAASIVAPLDGGFLQGSHEGRDAGSSDQWTQGGGSSGSQQQRQEDSHQQDEPQPEWLAEWEQNLAAPSRIPRGN